MLRRSLYNKSIRLGIICRRNYRKKDMDDCIELKESKVQKYLEMSHYPVLYKSILEIIREYINTKESFLIGDCTIGGGNHSKHILNTFSKSHIIGLDVDPYMVELSAHNLNYFTGNHERLQLYHLNYNSLGELGNLDLCFGGDVFDYPKFFDVLFLDLGINSYIYIYIYNHRYQLEDGERGFSFKEESKFDMRFDQFMENSIQGMDIVSYIIF